MPDLSPLWLTLLTSFCAVLLVVPIGTFFAWKLAQWRPNAFKHVLETLLFLPMVIPPSAVGYTLLLLFGERSPFGHWLNGIGIHLIFTWQAAAIAAAVIAAPLYIRTVSSALASVDPELLEAGRTLGATESSLLRFVTLPLASRGLLAGLTLAFARAMGEFGATFMVAGSIPGQTQTLPLALYSATQSGRDHDALTYTIIIVMIAFMLLLVAGTQERHLYASHKQVSKEP